jgi:hypothetical protein
MLDIAKHSKVFAACARLDDAPFISVASVGYARNPRRAKKERAGFHGPARSRQKKETIIMEAGAPRLCPSYQKIGPRQVKLDASLRDLR